MVLLVIGKRPSENENGRHQIHDRCERKASERFADAFPERWCRPKRAGLLCSPDPSIRASSVASSSAWGPSGSSSFPSRSASRHEPSTRENHEPDRDQQPDEGFRTRCGPSTTSASASARKDRWFPRAQRVRQDDDPPSLLGLVTPTSGNAKIRGPSYSELSDPIREVGTMLEAAAHPARSARGHLKIIAAEAGIPGAHRGGPRPGRPSRRRAGRWAVSHSGCVSGSGSPGRCWAIPKFLSWTSRRTAWTPRASAGFEGSCDFASRVGRSSSRVSPSGGRRDR